MRPVNATKLVRADENTLFKLNRFYRRNGHRGKAKVEHHAWWLEIEGEIACGLRLEPLQTEHGKIHLLRGMWVEKHRRNQGLGGQLLQQLAQPLSESPCYCLPYLPQQAFYLRNGFQHLTDRAPALLRQKQQTYQQRGETLALMHYIASPISPYPMGQDRKKN